MPDIDIMSALSPAQRASLERDAVKRTYRKGTVISDPDDENDSVNFVVSGRVKIYSLSACGNEIIFRFCGPNSFFGIAGLFGAGQRNVFSEAVEDTEVMSINSASVERVVSENPALAMSLIRVLSSRIRQAHEAIREFVFCDARSRVAHLLIKLAEIEGGGHHGAPVRLKGKMTHQDIADMIGTTRQTVTEILNEFKRQGYVKSEARTIVVLDCQRLRDVITD
ncbi:MAG: Crp/Fnr family transcriptional regulator [Thermodesulfobacteriota bacterium]